MRFILGAICCLLTMAATPATAQDEPRLALLIGNESYPASVGQLSQSHEDVERLSAVLEQVGFEVATVLDADEDAIELAVTRFAAQLSEAGETATGFFYYAGHGGSAVVSGERTNFLIPSNEEITDVATLSVHGVEEEDVINALSSAGAHAVFVVIDACRNELLPALGARSAGERGFGVTAARAGLFIAHSTYPGQTAPDDGAFSRALAGELVLPARHASRAFELAYRRVASAREGYALPTSSASLRDDFCFVSCPDAEGSASEVAYRRAAADGRPEVLQAYLFMFPESERAAEIRILLSEDGTPAAPPAETGTAEAVIEFLEAVDFFGPNYSTSDVLDRVVELHGLDALMVATEAGDSRAAAVAGLAYFQSEYVEQDQERGVELYRRACDGGVMPGCNNYAGALAWGIGVEEDDVAAAAIYRRTCENGSGFGCERLAGMYTRDAEMAQESEQVLRTLRSACDRHSNEACSILGVMYVLGGHVEQDYSEALRIFERGCEAGDAASCANAAIRYARGEPAPQNYGESALRRRRACELGDGVSCIELGHLYRQGLGVVRDETEAVVWFRRGCESHRALNFGCTYASRLMSSSHDERVRNGEEALRLAQTALDMSASSMALDAIARGHAELGQFDEAISNQVRAIEEARRIRANNSGMADRLELYRQGRPFRGWE